MKACIVKSSTIAKHGRMDAKYYIGLGDEENFDEALERAYKTLRRTISRIRNLRAKRKEFRARHQQMIDDGEIIPLA